MVNKQKSGTKDSVQKFYSLIYMEFNRIIKENPQQYINEDLNGDNFIHYFEKYFKNFVKNGKFFVELEKTVKEEGKKKKITVSVPYLELHTEKEENFVFVNNNIKKLKDNFNKTHFETCKKLAEEMRYDFKSYPYKKENNKTSYKKGFRIPYSDFEREIFMHAFEKSNSKSIKLEKEKEVLSKEKEGLEKEILLKKNEIKNLKYDKQKNEESINDLEWEIKESKDQNEGLINQISKFKSENVSIKIDLDEANIKLAENKKLINTLVYKIRKDTSEFEKFKRNYGVVLYNIWRLGRTIERDYEFNKQNFESINNLIDIIGKNLDDCRDDFKDNKVDSEFIENQKVLMNDSLKSLERFSKQYNRILILLEKSGIRIEEYDDIKDEDKLNVTILDVTKSSEVQEIMVETVKPSIYYDEKRIFEGEVIITEPKE